MILLGKQIFSIEKELMMARFARYMVSITLCLMSFVCWGEVNCQIKVFQDQKEINPSEFSTLEVAPNAYIPIPTFILKATEFQIAVSPLECKPTIATIPNIETLKKIAGKDPLIYASRWAYVMAANPEDSDKLLWWARTEAAPQLYTPPDPNTFKGKQYLKLCEELSACPNIYPPFSASRPFVNVGSESVASFKRLDNERQLADAKGKGVLSVIYTLWHSLPSEYPMADPEDLLFRPRFFYLKFLEDQ